MWASGAEERLQAQRCDIMNISGSVNSKSLKCDSLQNFPDSIWWISHCPSSGKALGSTHLLISCHRSSLFTTFWFVLTRFTYNHHFIPPSLPPSALHLQERDGARWSDHSFHISYKSLWGVSPSQIGFFIIYCSTCSAILISLLLLSPESLFKNSSDSLLTISRFEFTVVLC